MYYLLMAWLPALLGAVPLLLRKKLGAAAALFIISGVVLQLFAWLGQPSTAYPLFGFAGFWTIVLWLVAAIIDGLGEGEPTHTAWLPAAGFTLLIGTWVMSWGMFNADNYSGLLGTVAAKEWTSTTQPKDPKHMAMVTPTTAEYLARKAIGQDGAIGSQFNIDTDTMTEQLVNHELVYLFPLEYSGYSVWTSAGGVPAYILVYAEDPERKPVMVKLSPEHVLNYTPGAYFSNNLKRHMREQGHLNVGFALPRFEVDDQGRPWWITTTYKPTIGWSGEKLSSVLVTNPNSGETTEYALKDVPKWIDRVVPGDIVNEYISWRGNLSGGWWNSFWAQKELTEPEGYPVLIYGADNRPMWVTDITSNNGKDDSLLGLIYTDSRTGVSSYYAVNGGGTTTAIIAAVDKHPKVQYLHLHADYVQVYNIDGTMGAVVPLLNDNGAFQGVAIAELKNPQDVAVGVTQFEALIEYKKLLARRGQQIAVNGIVEVGTLHGTIGRIHQDVSAVNGGTYYFTVTGTAKIFTASSKDYPKLPLTERGDLVDVKYLASSESMLTVMGFDNTSIVVEQSADEVAVTTAAKGRQQTEVNRDNSTDLQGQFDNLSPEQKVEALKRAKP